MPISFVAAGAVATGANPTVAVPAGITANDLLILVTCGSAAPTAPTGWLLLSTQAVGRFLTIYYKYTSGTESSLALVQAGTITKAVMIAYRDAGAFQLVPAYTSATSTTATPNTVTTTYANAYVTSIYAMGNDPVFGGNFWTPNGSTTSRVNSNSTINRAGLLIADELQASTGASTARSATLSQSQAWTSIAIAFVPSRSQVYWVGGAGTWNKITTTNWADTSGGTGGVLPPSPIDSATIDGNSGTGVITCTGGNCEDLIVLASQAITLGASSSSLSVYGDLFFPSGGSFSASGAQWTLTFAAVTTGKTITTNGKGIRIITFDGPGGWTLVDSLLVNDGVNSNLSLLAGSLNTNNQSVTLTGSYGNFNIDGTSVRSLTLGASVITFTGITAPIWNVASTTNLTFNAGTSSIVFNPGAITGATPTFAGGNLTYNNLTISGANGGTFLSIQNVNTFSSFSITSQTTLGAYNVVQLFSDQVINTLTLSTSDETERIVFQSNSISTPRALTVTSASVTNVDFRDITIAGGASPLTGTSLGDLGGNSGITFTAPKTVYWNLAGSQNWWSTGWATSSGGTPAVSNFPLAQDTAVFDNAGAAGTIELRTADVIPPICTIDASLRTSAMTLSTVSGGITAYGDWSNGTGLTLNGSGTTITFANRSSTKTINGAGATFTQFLAINNINGTIVLGSSLTSATIFFTSGSFNTNNQTVNATAIAGSNSNTRTLTLGTSTLNLSGTLPWDFSATTGLTFSGASSTINLTNNSTSNRTVNAGTLTYGTINIGGATAISSTNFNGSSFTIGTLTSTKTVAHTIAIQNNFTVTNWNVTGTVGNVVTVQSSTANTQRTITYNGSQINLDYMSFRDIYFFYPLDAANPYRVYAGANSTNLGNNIGIAFINGLTRKAYLLTTGTSWTVPVDWDNTNNNIYLIGAGGGGANTAQSGNNKAGGGGGGGGGYTVLTNQTLTGTISYTVGASASNTSGGSTTWNSGAATAGGGSVGIATTTPTSSGGAGGAGTFAGGTGGAGGFGTTASTAYSGGGGGGAGGPNGVGRNGGNGFGSTTSSNLGGGGGGGSDGGTNGNNGTIATGGTGGNNFSGTGGGTSGTRGRFGGGGGGGAGTPSGLGGDGINIQNTLGSGGGAGGGGNSSTAAGGLYGGGGGGGRINTIGASFSGSAGGSGAIFIVYSSGGDVTVTLTGVSATTQLGTVTVIPTDITVSLSGLQAITLLGTATTISSVAVDLAGVQGNTVLGTPTVIGNANTNITGVVGTTDLGSVTVTFPTNITVDLTGVVGATQLGTANLVTDNFINVTGLVGTTQLGTVAALISIDVSVTGVSGTTILGNVEAIESVFITLIGVQATFILNLVNVWGDIIPVPTSPWDPVDASQTETWVIIDKAAG
jgi:hypothetical protein